MTGAGPSAEQVERFRASLEALANGPPGHVGVAVSGGPDSLALLLLARAAMPGAVVAATVDHGLRSESADEAAFVATVCRGLDAPHVILRPNEPISGNLQAAARRARYALLERWRAERGLDWLLTGHHADDQAETLLMRLNRGAGIAGLSGVRARNGQILRPLLGWRRTELAEIPAAAGVEPIEDPSNSDPQFDRVRIRRELERSDWIEPTAVARSAAALAEANAALEWMLEVLEAERVSVQGQALLFDATGLPAELRRRLVGRVLRRLAAGAEPRGEEVSRLLSSLERGGTTTLAGIKAVGETPWRFEPAPPRRSG